VIAVDAEDPRVRPKTTTRPDSSAEEAHDVQTVVVHDRGRWAVEIIVVFPDGVVRTRIETYPTKARAEIAARLIKRAAERELRGPLNG
jgi:hypothetical protein